MWKRALVLAAAALGACTLQPAKIDDPFSIESVIAQGPNGIGQDRIRLTGEISSPEGLGYQAGFSDRFKKILGGSHSSRLVRPYAIDENEDWLIIADPGAGQVLCMDKNRRRFRVIGATESELFSSPVGVALTDSALYVADSAIGKVFKFDHKQNLLRTLDRFQRPTSLAYDHLTRRLFVTDTASHNITVLDETGKIQQIIGHRGTGEGEFNYPTHIALMGDRLLVVDSLNFRVQILSVGGEFLGSFGVHGDQPGQFAQPKGIAVDRDGNIYVAESVSGLIQIFDLDGNYLMSFGSLGSEPGQFVLPAGIYIEEDRVYIADSGNGRIQLFRYLGAQR